jgi:hypothetical protein
VALKGIVFWDKTLCSLLIVNWCFRGIYNLHLQDTRIIWPQHHCESRWHYLSPAFTLYFARLTLIPWRWRQCVHLKYSWLSENYTALCYKLEGRGFETRWGGFFFFNLRNPSGRTSFCVHSDSNINEYQKQKNNCFWGVQCRWCVGLTALMPSVSGLSWQCGILNISQPYRPAWPVTGIVLLYWDEVCCDWGRNWTVSIAKSSQCLAVNCEPIV